MPLPIGSFGSHSPLIWRSWLANRTSLGVVAAEDELEAAVRNQRLAHVCLLCCGDDRLAELAHLASESRRHADFTGSLAGEDVVAFIEDEDVLQRFARRIRVLPEQQNRLEEEEAEEALLILTEAL